MHSIRTIRSSTLCGDTESGCQGKKFRIARRDTFAIRGGGAHGASAIEDSLVIDVSLLQGRLHNLSHFFSFSLPLLEKIRLYAKGFLTALWIIPALCFSFGAGSAADQKHQDCHFQPWRPCTKNRDIVIFHRAVSEVAPDFTPGSLI